MKKATALIAVILIMCSMLCACNQAADESLFGEWTYSVDNANITYTFYTDGTGSISAMAGMLSVSFAYELNNGEITFHELGDEVMGEEPYEYSINGDKLTLSQGTDTLELTKKN